MVVLMVRRSFRDLADLADLNLQAHAWVVNESRFSQRWHHSARSAGLIRYLLTGRS